MKLEANRERFLPLKEHHTHNRPPNTMLAAITEMLPTSQIMKSSYNMESAPKKLYQIIPLSQANQKRPLSLWISITSRHARAGSSVHHRRAYHEMIQCHCLWPFAASHLMRYPTNPPGLSPAGTRTLGRMGREQPGALLAR